MYRKKLEKYNKTLTQTDVYKKREGKCIQAWENGDEL